MANIRKISEFCITIFWRILSSAQIQYFSIYTTEYMFADGLYDLLASIESVAKIELILVYIGQMNHIHFVNVELLS